MAAAFFHIAMMKLKRSWLRVTHVWVAIYVERHGLYSVERLRNFQKYQSSGSLARSWFILLLTSLPCLAVITLLDVIPLKPPDVGLTSSHSWLRGFATNGIFEIAVTVQLRDLVPRLSICGETC